jgi:hypothetical protein
MATSDVIANLLTTQSQLAAQLAAVTANPQPTYNVGERSFSWAEYYRMLSDELKAVTEQIIRLQPYSIASQVL